MLTVAGLIGLYLIWEDALPALRVLDDIVLWHTSATVDGAEQAQPVTLAAVGLALIYGITTWLLATRLPALIEIVLLRRFDMAPSGRYTVTALTTNVIVAVGILLVLSTLGARWSQLQHLVAALTVGALLYVVASTGFGLLVSSFVKTQIAAIFAAAILSIMPTINFSGFLSPVSALEAGGKLIGYGFPASYFQQISVGTFTKALGFTDLLGSYLALALCIVVILALSLALLRLQER
mgnify:CR=1 FL=1